MQQQDYLADLSVDTSAAQHLRDLAKWAKFLSIVSFIACAFIVVAGIYVAITFAKLSEYSRELGSGYSSGYGIGMAIGYTIFAVIWFIPSLFLFQASVKVKSGLDHTDQMTLNEGLAKLKACFRYWGIMTILIISLYVVVIIFSLLK